MEVANERVGRQRRERRSLFRIGGLARQPYFACIACVAIAGARDETTGFRAIGEIRTQ